MRLVRGDAKILKREALQFPQGSGVATEIQVAFINEKGGAFAMLKLQCEQPFAPMNQEAAPRWLSSGR